MRELNQIICLIGKNLVAALLDFIIYVKHIVLKVMNILLKILLFIRAKLDFVGNALILKEGNIDINLDPSSNLWSLNRRQLTYALIQARAREEEAQRRYDELFNEYKSTVSSVLETIKPVREPEPDRKVEHKPIRVARQSWSSVAAKKEAQDRQEYWNERSKELEKELKIDG